MRSFTKALALLLTFVMAMGLCVTANAETAANLDETTADERTRIENTLNLANNGGQEWTYNSGADAWVLSVVSAVAYPELPDQQGVSVCVPGAYVKGIDTDGDGVADVTGTDANGAVKGALVIDYEAEITSANGQVYTAATAPVIINTGAAGYGSQNNQAASASHAADGYINVTCGNRGKQDTATDDSGNTYYTGDAPSCLVDQKAAARYVKYNILLGNLPGNVDYFVSTGGSGGGAHAAMFAATGNNPVYYDYQIEAGAVGVYRNADGSYSTTVAIDGTDYELSDGAWGCIAYSAVTSLYEADMTLAFEYYLNTSYSFKTDFQKQLAAYLSEAYMEYINAKNLSVKESDVGFDLDGDGELDSTIALTIEYDLDAHPETNGYYGSYLDLYLAEFTQNLQWYVDSLDYAEGWTWFDENGNALSDSEVAAMATKDKAQAFLEGRYASSGSMGGMMGGMPGGMGNMDFMGGGMDKLQNIEGVSELYAELESKGLSDEMPQTIDEIITWAKALIDDGTLDDSWLDTVKALEEEVPELGNMAGEPGGKMAGEPGGDTSGMGDIVGTPDVGTTQSNTGGGDSKNYAAYEEMVAAYKADIEEIYVGDQYGNNIVDLYNPLNYINADGTENPAWTKIIMGASEGDISLFNSLNMQIAWLDAGVDAQIEWQWNGGHVPSEILGDSFSLYVDQMYGEYVDGAMAITKPEAEKQAENGTGTSANGSDISGYVSYTDGKVSFSLASAAVYRTAGASKAMPGFDVIDYGQEDYVFGSSEKDARHWDAILLSIFEEHADVLSLLFNASGADAEAKSDGLPLWAIILIAGGVVVIGGSVAAVVIVKKKRKKTA